MVCCSDSKSLSVLGEDFDSLGLAIANDIFPAARIHTTLAEHPHCPSLTKSMAFLKVLPPPSNRNGIFSLAPEFEGGAGGRHCHVRSDFGQVMNLSGFRTPSRPKSSARAWAASTRGFRIPRPFFRPFLRASEEMDNTLRALPEMSVQSFTSEQPHAQHSDPDRRNFQPVSFLRS